MGITYGDPDMADTCRHQVLQVTRSQETAPVSDHSLLVNLRLQFLSVGPLVNNLILQISHVDFFKEDWSYPRLQQKPASQVDSSDNAVITTQLR